MRWVADRAVRPYPALAACVTLLAIWDVLVRPVLPSALHPTVGLVVAGGILVISLWGGVDVDGLGLSPRRFLDGLRYGGLAFGAVAAVVLLGAVIPLTRSSFETPRGEIPAGQLVLELLVTIPVGTVIVEEIVFRGALLGLLRLVMPTAWAVVVCSVLFGLWHVPGVIASTSGSAGHVMAAVAGTFLATFAAGVVFCWLRIRSGSLVAPVLAHLATNTLALLVAWLVVR